MEHAEFRIGLEFMTSSERWRVTDVGARTVIAIKLDQDDPRNYNGPPYSIVEHVFDEYDLEGCLLPSPSDELDAIAQRGVNLPILDPRAADEIIGYDENGLPS